MAKILISPIGAGSLDSKNKSARAYRTASYCIDNKQYDKTFIASVLYEHLNLDGIIFIGTVKSMWEEVYRFFCQEKLVDCDENYYLSLVEKIEKLNYTSSLDELDLSPIEEVLGSRSKCILIKYGLNEEELQENFDSIIKVIDCLKTGDEIYIDITHSFRSLSIFLLLVIIFINDLIDDKEISVRGIYYGMLDISREIGNAPVVNLQLLFNLIQWIKGAYSLKEFGNGYLISDLLEQQGENALASEIAEISDVINLNYLPDIKKKGIYLKTALKKSQNNTPFKYLKNILEKSIQNFTVQSKSERESEFQLRLAKWYFDNKRYATGYITLAEAIVTYACEISGRNFNNKEHRDRAKDDLWNGNNELSDIFRDINPIRTLIAHASFDKKRTSYKEAVRKSNYYIQKVQGIFKKGSLGENRS